MKHEGRDITDDGDDGSDNDSDDDSDDEADGNGNGEGGFAVDHFIHVHRTVSVPFSLVSPSYAHEMAAS